MRNVTISGRDVPAVGFGCMGLSWAYTDPTVDRNAQIRLLHRAADLGITMFDTSDQYGPFLNEDLLGRAMADRRDQLFIATKGGLVVDSAGVTHRDATPQHLRAAIDASLARLRTDHVDLYQLHRVDPNVPLEESWGTLASFVADGKVTAIGLSEVSVDEIRRAQQIHPVASVQSELSLTSRDALDEVVPYCLEHGITFIAFSPLGRGFLSGRITNSEHLGSSDWRRHHPRFQDEALRLNTQRILVPLQQQALQLGYTPAQLAHSWVLAQGPHVLTIPGTQREHYLVENWQAGDIQIPSDMLHVLDSLPAPVGSRGLA